MSLLKQRLIRDGYAPLSDEELEVYHQQLLDQGVNEELADTLVAMAWGVCNISPRHAQEALVLESRSFKDLESDFFFDTLEGEPEDG